MSFWDDPTYRAALPEWVAVSAHNGYIEIFLAGGLVACSLLGLLLLSTALRINKALAAGEEHAVARFAILCVALIANFSESNFACMTPIGFLFLVASIGAVECIDAYHHALFPRGAQPDVARPSLSHS
jgi:O-antigen ligase